MPDKQPETGSFSILLGCGIAGVTSDEITYLKKMVSDRNYKEIAKSLDSRFPLSQVVAAIALEELSRRGLWKLSPRQEISIATLRRSPQPYSLCSGCTYHVKGIVSDIFSHGSNEKNFLNTAYHIRYALGLAD